MDKRRNPYRIAQWIFGIIFVVSATATCVVFGPIRPLLADQFQPTVQGLAANGGFGDDVARLDSTRKPIFSATAYSSDIESDLSTQNAEVEETVRSLQATIAYLESLNASATQSAEAVATGSAIQSKVESLELEVQMMGETLSQARDAQALAGAASPAETPTAIDEPSSFGRDATAYAKTAESFIAPFASAVGLIGLVFSTLGKRRKDKIEADKERASLELEHKKLILEQDRLALEKERLELEKKKMGGAEVNDGNSPPEGLKDDTRPLEKG